MQGLQTVPATRYRQQSSDAKSASSFCNCTRPAVASGISCTACALHGARLLSPHFVSPQQSEAKGSNLHIVLCALSFCQMLSLCPLLEMVHPI